MTPPAASAAGTRTLPRPVAPRNPRRVSGPQTRTRRGEDARRAARKPRARGKNDPFIFRVLRGTQQLADSRLLDRLIRGRLWIPIVAAALMGIVFMQVSMLKLNAGIGRAVQASGTLERQNSALRAEVSGLEAGSRIDGAAHDLGMVVPADGSTKYVTAGGREQAASAAKRMVAADPDAIARAKAGTALAQGQAAGAVTTGTATAAAPPGQTQTQAQTGTATPAATGTTATATPQATTTPQATGTGTAQGAGTTGTTGTASTPSAVTQPSAGTTGTTGATGAATAEQAAPPATTSGGAVAPPQG